MAKPPANILPSLLDRLIDETPDAERDVPKSRAQQLVALRNAVRRDLEALLNSHCRCISPPAGLDQLQESVIEYGVGDFLSQFGGLHAFREQFRASLEETIKRFEPRFVTAEVILREDEDNTDRTMRFRIDALMYAEPAPERVSFDSQLDPANQTFQVRANDDA